MRFRRFLLTAFVCAAGALGAAAAGLFFFTGPVVESAGRLLDRRGVMSFEGDVRGNLLTGFEARGLRLGLPQADVYVPLARLDVSLRPLLHKTVRVNSVFLQSPEVRLKRPKGPKAPKPPRRGPPSWTFELADGQVRQGAFWPPNAGSAPAARGVHLDVRFAGNTLTVSEARATVAAGTVTARGTVTPAPLRVDAAMGFVGAAAVEAKVHGSTETLHVDTHGTWEKTRFQAKAVLRDLKFWEGTAAFQNLDVARWYEPAATLGALSGELTFDGEEFSPEKMTARAGFWTRGAGLSARGEASLAQNLARWDADLLGVATGTLRGQWALSNGQLKTQAHLKTALAAFTPGEGDVAVDAAAEGRWPRLRWEANAQTADFRWGATAADHINLSASGTGPESLTFTARAGADDVRVGAKPAKDGRPASEPGPAADGRRIDSAVVSIDGGLDSHQLAVEINSEAVSLNAGGRGAWAGGVWAVDWTRLDARAVRAWNIEGPFRTEVGKNHAALKNLAFTDGNDRARVDATLHEKRWERLFIAVDRFDTRPWAEAGLWPLPVDGVFRVNADLRGALAAPEGAVALRLSSATARGVALGDVRGEGRIKTRVFYLDELRWDTPQGALVVSGTVPVALAGGLPDFAFRLRAADVNPGVFAGFVPGLEVENGLFQADITLNHKDGRLSTAGTARFSADAIKIPTAGVAADEVAVLAVGDGGRVIVSEARARSGKGTLNLWGTLEGAGPRLELHASRFPIKHPLGLSLVADADLALENAWRAPLLRGRVSLREGDYTPPKKKKDEKKPAKEATPAIEKKPSPLAMDVALVFDRNVWFKQEESAIEAKGDLDIKKDSGGPLRVFGNVETLRGRYIYLGRTFDIEEGALGFLGTAPPDPELNVRAVYTALPSGTKVILNVTGTARAPRLELSSEPPLSEEDIVNVLVFGQPSGGTGGTEDGTESSPENRGAQMAGSLLASYLLSEARDTTVFRALDLDVFQLKATGEGAGVTVGRYLTQDLFVSYEQTLGENGQRRVNAEYSLTERWMLNGKTGSEGRYTIDLLFRYPL